MSRFLFWKKNILMCKMGVFIWNWWKKKKKKEKENKVRGSIIPNGLKYNYSSQGWSHNCPTWGLLFAEFPLWTELSRLMVISSSPLQPIILKPGEMRPADNSLKNRPETPLLNHPPKHAYKQLDYRSTPIIPAKKKYRILNTPLTTMIWIFPISTISWI